MQIDFNKVNLSFQKVLQLLTDSHVRIPRATPDPVAPDPVAAGKSNFRLQLPSLAWLLHNGHAAASATPVMTLPETTLTIAATCVKVRPPTWQDSSSPQLLRIIAAQMSPKVLEAGTDST